MGLNTHHARFLLLARSGGVRFERPLMIGRQELFVDARSLRRVLATGGIRVTEQDARRLLEEEDGFADPLLRLLGAAHVDAIDLSSYEGATIVHDLNEPIPLSLRNRYSVVLESGSLEHVFTISRAMRNCLEMVEDGGHFISIGPANNSMGHGFYQFSPELYFRILSPQNGFRIERIVAREMHDDAPWYAVSDPAVVGRRVEWQPLGETHLMVCARKERTVELFDPVPQQSDYVRDWTKEHGPAGDARRSPPVHHHDSKCTPLSKPSLRSRVWRYVPLPMKTVYRRLKRLYALDRALSVPDPACFTRIDLPPLPSE